MENEKIIDMPNDAWLLAQFEKDLSFGFLETLSAEYFAEGSATMRIIKTATTEFLTKFEGVFAGCKDEEELKLAKSAFAFYDHQFNRIVKEKRDQILTQEKDSALKQIGERMAMFPQTYVPEKTSQEALIKTGLLVKMGLKGRGVTTLREVPDEFWTDSKLYNAVLYKVSAYLRGYEERVSRAISKKDIAAALKGFETEYALFETISTEQIAKAERTAQESRNQLEGARASALRDVTKRIGRIDTKYHHTPAQDLGMGRDYKC